MTNVRIEVQIDPRQATSGARAVGKEIERLEGSADSLRDSIRDSVAIDSGAATAGAQRVKLELENAARTADRLGVSIGDALAVDAPAGGVKEVQAEIENSQHAAERMGVAIDESLDVDESFLTTLEKTRQELLLDEQAADELDESMDQAFDVNPKPAIDGAKRTRHEIDATAAAADKLRSVIRNAFAGVGVALIVRELVQAADAYTNLQNRIRVVTDGEEELADVTAQLFKISNDTRSSFAETAELYTRTALAARDLGISQRETLQFTRSLNQAVILSGASAAEASGGIIQLSQGIASGALRGDELRSVLEQLPAVADVIARSLGVTRGELRELGKEGKITSEVILTAFAEARDELETGFGETVPTIGQSFVVLKNNLIGAAEGFQGATNSVSEFVLIGAQAIRGAGLLARGFSDMVDTDVAGFLHKVNEELGQFFDEIDERGDANFTAFGKAGDTIIRLQQGLAAAQSRRQSIVDAGELVPPGLDASIASITNRIAELRGEQGKMAESANKASAAQKNIVAGTILDELREEARLLQFGNREREVQIDLARALDEIKKKGKGDFDPAEIEAQIRENQLLRDKADALQLVQGPAEQFQAQVRALNVLQGEGVISGDQFADTVEKLAESLKDVDVSGLDLAGIDFSGIEGGSLDAFIAKVKELSAAQKTSFETVKADLLEEQRLLGLSAQEREVQIELLKQLDAIEKDQGAAARAEAEPRLQALLEENQALALRAQILEQINGPAAALVTTQAALNELLASGAISAQQYAIALGNAKLGVDGLGRSASEGAASGLQEIENRLVDVGGTVHETLVNGFSAAEDALVSFVRTGEADFHGLVESILDDLARLLVQQAILGIFGGQGAAAGSGFFGFGGNKADGGNVEAGRSYMVGENNRPELFTPESAGRVHSGSQTERMMQPVVNVTTQPAVVQNIIVRDPREIPQALNTPEGEQAVLNIIRKNPGVVGRS